MKNFTILSKIGEGAYSEVLKVRRLSDNAQYAMKKVKMGSLKQKEKENALNEIRILASIEDPYIVAYKVEHLEAFLDDSSYSLIIIMEYADGGDLFKKITSHIQRKEFIPEKDVWRMMYQMLMGISFKYNSIALKTLHSMDILHRDLKSANVFCEQNGNYKLGDMNVSKVAQSGLVYTQTGTPYYASPEVWKDKPYDSKSDIWSLGCVAYEMTALKPPFRAADMEGLYKCVVKGQFERIPPQYSQDLMQVVQIMIYDQVISQCIQVNTKQRPSAEQLLNNPILLRNTKNFNLNDQNNKSYNNSPYMYAVGRNLIQKKGEKNILLSTIKMSKNLKQLSDNLPKSKYVKSQGNRSIDNSTLQGSFLPNIAYENDSLGNNRYNYQKSLDVYSNNQRNRYKVDDSMENEIRNKNKRNVVDNQQDDIQKRRLISEHQKNKTIKKYQYPNRRPQIDSQQVYQIAKIQLSNEMPPSYMPPILRNVDSQLKYINGSSQKLQNLYQEQQKVYDSQVKVHKQIQQKPVWWG